MSLFNKENNHNKNIWARPGMMVTFRAGLMPGKSSEERTFQVKEVLLNERVTLQNFAGEHTKNEFEPIKLSISKTSD